MGGCSGCQNVKKRLQLLYLTADRVFKKISKGQNFIDQSSITQHFGEFGVSTCKIIFREMDFDNDKKVTHQQWVAYWQYIRRSGYSIQQIIQQLKQIERGSIHLNFPKSPLYQRLSPRSTVISDVIRDLSTQCVLPFPLQK